MQTPENSGQGKSKKAKIKSRIFVNFNAVKLLLD
jgi:hypothetical protein